MPLQIEVSRREIADFCRRNQIRKLAVFGSALREDFTADSDVDVIVWFEPEARVGFFELFDMEEELSRLLAGRKADMNTPKMLSKYFRDRVISEAEVLYDRT
ncbi:MAG: nucleotidyltransferase domain-containing protein [Armatimonadota bacterium]|nr:nucleotidyltransferase domain-containing protein [Armatimonadota bacterium]